MPDFFKEKELFREKQEANGFEAVKAVSNSESLGVTNDNAYVNDVVRLVETAQDNGVYPNAPSAKVLEARIGNTAVRDIANKFFIKMSPDKARETAAVLDKTDMKFSGVIRDGKAKKLSKEKDKGIEKNPEKGDTTKGDDRQAI